MSSIFTRPRARSRLSAVSSQQVFREVNTEDELRAAVSADKIGAYAFGSTGRRIVIASPISIKSTITITAPGITIESHGKIPISPAVGSLPSLFDAKFATNSTFRNLLFTNPFFVAEPLACISAADISTIIDCAFNCGIDGISVSASYVKIIGNTFVGVTSNSVRVISGSYNIISSNMSVGDIVVGSSALRTAISGNTMIGFDIDTSLSGGFNTIVGNVDVGSITFAATDAVTSNT